ncbi:hypothetical protein GF360_04240 [candidate division WWE3 bacterium]|nr:hypothetical protein [candidate division WWE3 bacterium]
MKKTNPSTKSPKKTKNNHTFHNWSDTVSKIVGSPYWFLFSFAIIIVWVPSGFFFGFNDIWHLLINTTTTILTFLMMSLLHASQDQWEKKMDRTQDREREEMREIRKHLEELEKRIK